MNQDQQPAELPLHRRAVSRRFGGSAVTGCQQIVKQKIEDKDLKKTIELLVANFAYILEYYEKLGNNTLTSSTSIEEKKATIKNIEDKITKIINLRLEIESLKLKIENLKIQDQFGLIQSIQSIQSIREIQEILEAIIASRKKMDISAAEIYQLNGDIRWLPSYFNPIIFQRILQDRVNNIFSDKESLSQAREYMIPSEGGISTVIGLFLAPALDPKLLSLSIPVEKRFSKRPFIQLTRAGIFLFSKEPSEQFSSFTSQLGEYLQDICCSKNLSYSVDKLLATKEDLGEIEADKKAKLVKYFLELEEETIQQNAEIEKLFQQTINDQITNKKVVLIPHWAIPYILQLAKFYPQDIEPSMGDFYDGVQLGGSLFELIASSYQKIINMYSPAIPNLSLALYKDLNATDESLRLNVRFTLPSDSDVFSTTTLPPILFLVDDSGSMDCYNRMNIARSLLMNFYEKIPEGTEFALNIFNGKRKNLCKRTKKNSLSSERNQWENILSKIVPGGGTVFKNAFEELGEHIIPGEDISDMVIVLITDGGTKETVVEFINGMRSAFGGQKLPHIIPIGVLPENESDVQTVLAISADVTIGNIGYYLIRNLLLKENQKIAEVTEDIADKVLDAIGRGRQSVSMHITLANGDPQTISLGDMIPGTTKSFQITIPAVKEGDKIDVGVLSGVSSYNNYVLEVSNVFDLNCDMVDYSVMPLYLECFKYASDAIKKENITLIDEQQIKNVINSIINQLSSLLNYYSDFTETKLAKQIIMDLRNFKNSEFENQKKYLIDRFDELKMNTLLPPHSIGGAKASLVYPNNSGSRSKKAGTSNKTNVETTVLKVSLLDLETHLNIYGKNKVVWKKADSLYTSVLLLEKTEEVFRLIIDNQMDLQEATRWFSQDSQIEGIIYLFLTTLYDDKLYFKHQAKYLEHIYLQLFGKGKDVKLPLCESMMVVDPALEVTSSQQPFHLTIKIKHYCSPYLFFDEEQNVYLMVPVANVGNTQIALDNTCQGLRAYKDWQAHCFKDLEKASKYYASLGGVHNNIAAQVDYYLTFLRDFLHGDFLTASGKRKRDISGFNLPPSIVNVLKERGANYVNLWLTPHAPLDDCCPFPDSVPPAFRMRYKSSETGFFPNQLLNDLKNCSFNVNGNFNLPLLFGQNITLNESMINQIIIEYTRQNPETPIRNQDDFNKLIKLINAKINSFQVDPSINLSSWCKSDVSGLEPLPAEATEEVALETLDKFIQSETVNGTYPYIENDIESMIRYLAQNRTDLNSLPSPLSGELSIKQLSIRIQLWLGMLSVFAYQHTGIMFDLGKFISRDIDLSNALRVHIINFITSSAFTAKEISLENYIIDFLQKWTVDKEKLKELTLEFEAFQLALSGINREMATRTFAEAVFTVDQSQHYDNFQIYFDSFLYGNVNKVGSFYKFLGQVSLPLEAFLTQFSATTDITSHKLSKWNELLLKLQGMKKLEIYGKNTLDHSSFGKGELIDIVNLEFSALVEVLVTKTEQGYNFEYLEEDACEAILRRTDFGNLYAEIDVYYPEVSDKFRKKFPPKDKYKEKEYSYYVLSPQQVLAIEFALGGQYYFLDNFSSTIDRIEQFFNRDPNPISDLQIKENIPQSGYYAVKVHVDKSLHISEKLADLRTSLHLTPSIAATLYHAVKVADQNKGERLHLKSNEQGQHYSKTKIYAALEALKLPVDTILELNYSGMNGYIFKLKKRSSLVTRVLEIYQTVISSNQLVGQVFKGQQLLHLCNYLGFDVATISNISKENFLAKLHEKFVLNLHQDLHSRQFFSIAEAIGHGGNFTIEISLNDFGYPCVHLWAIYENVAGTTQERISEEGLLLETRVLLLL